MAEIYWCITLGELMAKLKIKREELEKLLRDTLGVSKVTWDKNGNAEVDIDLDKVKEVKIVEKEKIIERDRIVYPQVIYPRPYPIYIDTPPIRIRPPSRYWISCNNNTLTYSKG